MAADVVVEVIAKLLYGLGAFIFWLLKGCNTKLTDEIENYKMRNAILSSIIFALIVMIVMQINN